MIRTLLFLVLMYLLIKFISRLFLPSGSSKDRRRGSSFIHQTFSQFQQNQKQQNGSSRQQGKNHFEEIEEAEYEDITEEENSASKSSD
ncbi:hypothetical protein [Fodinibius sediminis]|uniref:DUF4834 domain-containing protein n=1 Tax=Fodinibius sediminis TaxID=1214077 RepID=A0A521CMR8_9BACT|nr:hypothetical protein [Fodinibius sediminis]SMO60688.1 hypothetical protein SAMN06265218_106223 [Fodinibius sediminis]